jgi:cell wall-associated NlpC family hydrolase
VSVFDRFVGIPFREHGRDAYGCDCWGLVRLVFQELRGIELPSYDDRYVSASERAVTEAVIAGEMGPWDDVPAGQETAFDVILLRRLGHVSHIALVIEPGRMLHVSSDGIASHVERYRDAKVRGRIVGFYRYRHG